MANMTFGIDISVWQSNDAKNPTYTFNPFIAKEKGVQFAFIRASIGSSQDNAVDKVAADFERAKLPHGFYHFLRSDVSYITQADKFLSVIEEYDYQLPPVCDVEHAGLGLEMVRQWCGRVASKLGIKPIIYTSPGFWNGLRDVDKATWALDYDYWVAHYLKLSYPVYDIPDAVKNSTTYPIQLTPWKQAGKPWTFWQFCASGDGEFYGGDYAKHTDKTSLDMNAFNGTLAEFNTKFKLTEQSDVPTIPDPPDNTDIDARILSLQLDILELRGWARGIGYKG